MQHTDPVDLLFARAVAAGVQMATICDRAGVARSTPSRWKRNRKSATMSTIARLSEALGVIIAERDLNLAKVEGHAAGFTSSPSPQSPGKSAGLTAAQQSEAA